VYVTLEGVHIGGAGVVVLAGDFNGNILGEEVLDSSINQLIETFLPLLLAIGLRMLVSFI
jgi:hypothetical protein